MSDNKNKKSNKHLEEIDLLKIAQQILNKWYVFVFLGVLFTIFSIYYIFSTPPQFKTTGTILIKGEQGLNFNTLGGVDATLAAEFLNVGTAVDDEIIVFKSKTLLQQMVEELNLQTNVYYQKRLGGYHQLYNNEPFIIIFPENYKKTIQGSLTIEVEKTKKSTWKIKFKHKIGFETTKFKTEISDLSQSLNTPWGNFGFIEDQTKIDPEYPNYKLKFITVSKKSRIDEYSNLISASISSKKANAIDVSIEGDNIQKNEQIINKIIELYNRDNLTYKKQNTLGTLNVIEDRINTIKQELDIIDIKVEEYRIKNKLADITTQAGLAIETASLNEQAITDMEMEYTVIAFIENYIQNTDTITLIPNTDINSIELANLITAYNEEVIEYLRLTRYTNDDNPFVSQLKNKILLSRENIIQTINNTKKSIEIRKLEYIERNNKMNNQLSSIPSVEREYVKLVQDQEIKRSIYVFLLQQYESIQTALQTQSNSNKIIDYAYTPEKPIKPHKIITIFIAIFFAGIIGLIYIFISFLLSKTIEDKRQLSNLTNFPIIATIPSLKKKKINTEITEVFSSLRTNIILNSNNTTNQTILIINSEKDNDKDFIATETAISFARIKKKVAFIDLNKNSNKLTNLLNTSIITNLSNLIEQEDIEKTFYQNYNSNEEYINLYTIENSVNLSDLLISPKLNFLIKLIKEKYDYTIINYTISKNTTNLIILNKFANVSLFTCIPNVTTKESIRTLNILNQDEQPNNISIVWNNNVKK